MVKVGFGGKGKKGVFTTDERDRFAGGVLPSGGGGGIGWGGGGGGRVG